MIRFIYVLFSLFACTVCVRADPLGATNVTCSASYSWAENTLGQNPCLVAANLCAATTCYNADYTITALPAGDAYAGPGPLQPCVCNEVVYSLFSACADCQGHSFGNYADWTSGCNQTYAGYQGPVPSGTAIPDWATLDVIDTGEYSPSEAAADAASSSLAASSASVSSASSASSAASASSVSAASESASLASAESASFLSAESALSKSIATALSESVESVSSNSIASALSASSASVASAASASIASAVSAASASSFQHTVVVTSSTYATASSTSSTSPINGGGNPHKNNHVGAIVGGVVGGIAVLVLLALAPWWCQSERPSESGPREPDSSSAPPMQKYGAASPTEAQSYSPASPMTLSPPALSAMYITSPNRVINDPRGPSPDFGPLPNPFDTPLPTPGVHGRSISTFRRPPLGYSSVSVERIPSGYVGRPEV